MARPSALLFRGELTCLAPRHLATSQGLSATGFRASLLTGLPTSFGSQTKHTPQVQGGTCMLDPCPFLVPCAHELELRWGLFAAVWVISRCRGLQQYRRFVKRPYGAA